jgi:hypothetical protein
MIPRVFISRRRSDGADKADALARELIGRFGEEQVGVDERWETSSGAPRVHLDAASVLLVLMTPDYLGAVDAAGRPRIEASDDPVRIELEAAIRAGARVLPLLCDGVIALPDPSRLPPPFDTLSHLPWARLSEAEQEADHTRLAEELTRLGLVPRDSDGSDPTPSPAGAPDTTPMPPDAPDLPAPPGLPQNPYGTAEGRRNFFGVAAVAALLLGGWGVVRWRQQRAASLSGTWRTRISARGAASSQDGEPVLLTLSQKGTSLSLSSGAIDVERNPEWDVRRPRGAESTPLTYRGEGRIVGDAEDAASAASAAAPAKASAPASAASRAESERPFLQAAPLRRVVIEIRIGGDDGGAEPYDSGVFRGVVDGDDRRIHGWLRLQGGPDERAVDLRRTGG